jgi:hypothetical protein
VTATCPADVACAVAILAQHWPKRGGRHRAYLALIGGLLRARVAEETVAEIVRQLIKRTRDEDGEDARLANIADAKERLESDSKCTGWPSLVKRIGAEAVFQARLALDLAVNLDALSRAKRLPRDFLEGLGICDLAKTGYVEIPYRDAGGRTVVRRHRLSLRRNPRFRWEAGSKPIAYGEEHLDLAAKLGRLTLVEGESDCWTLWLHDEPALGIPGADLVAKTLQVGHVSCAKVIHVVQEPGAAGVEFVDNVRRRLAELGWSGQLYVIRLGDAKDPSELHCRDPQLFKRSWQEAFKAAEPVDLSPASVAAVGPPPEPSWPDPPGAEAFHGLAGEIVRLLEPASEADPAALAEKAEKAEKVPLPGGVPALFRASSCWAAGDARQLPRSQKGKCLPNLLGTRMTPESGVDVPAGQPVRSSTEQAEQLVCDGVAQGISEQVADGSLRVVPQRQGGQQVLRADDTALIEQGIEHAQAEDVCLGPPEHGPVVWAIEESSQVCLDIETTGLDPGQDRVRLLQLGTERGIWLIDCLAVDPSPLWEVLGDAERVILGANLIFDLPFLYRRHGFRHQGKLLDVVILSRLLTAGGEDRAAARRRPRRGVLLELEQAGAREGSAGPTRLPSEGGQG